MARVVVRPFDTAAIAGALACEGAFTITERLVVTTCAGGGFAHAAVPAATRRKRYPPLTEDDLAAHVGAGGKAGFVGEIEGRIAGRALVSGAWNGYARLDDLAVAPPFRRQGVGRALVERSVSWAREQGHAGVALETQDVNLAACRLYEQCGFVLGGVDALLYQGLDPGADEVALYWYLSFAGGRP